MLGTPSKAMQVRISWASSWPTRVTPALPACHQTVTVGTRPTSTPWAPKAIAARMSASRCHCR